MPHQTSNKRRPPSYYQPSITNFFYSANSSSTTIPSNPLPVNNNPVASSSTPRLPQSTQKDLLQVGMRIRKSLAEGYKQHQKQNTCDDYGYTRAGASIREAFYNPRAEEPESLPGSQDSSFSSSASFSHGTKRRQEDSDSEDDDEEGRGDRMMEGGVGTQMLEFDDRRDYVGEEQSQWILPPTTFLPSPAEFVPGRNGRKMHALPSRGGFVQSGFGGRNVHVPMSGGQGMGSGMDIDMGDDFGEASFLRPAGEF